MLKSCYNVTILLSACHLEPGLNALVRGLLGMDRVAGYRPDQNCCKVNHLLWLLVRGLLGMEKVGGYRPDQKCYKLCYVVSWVWRQLVATYQIRNVTKVNHLLWLLDVLSSTKRSGTLALLLRHPIALLRMAAVSRGHPSCST